MPEYKIMNEVNNESDSGRMKGSEIRNAQFQVGVWMDKDKIAEMKLN